MPPDMKAFKYEFVGVLGEIIVELQRADPEGQGRVPSRRSSDSVAAEAAEPALVVALVEAGALLEAEHLAVWRSNDSNTPTSIIAITTADHRHHNDARALRAATGWSAPSAPA